jgi:hypothetical protein
LSGGEVPARDILGKDQRGYINAVQPLTHLFRSDTACHRRVNPTFEIMLTSGDDLHGGTLARGKPPGVEEPSSAVAVWRLESPLVKVIVSPTATFSLAGLNFMPLIWTA